MREDRNAFKNLTGNPTGKRPLGRPMHIWEDNIRMDLKETGFIRAIWFIRLRIKNIGEPL